MSVYELCIFLSNEIFYVVAVNRMLYWNLLEVVNGVELQDFLEGIERDSFNFYFLILVEPQREEPMHVVTNFS